MANLIPLPPDPIVTPRPRPGANLSSAMRQFLKDIEWPISTSWSRYLVAQAQVTSQGPNQVAAPVSLTGQSASIGATSIAPGQVASGLYRLAYYARITQGATTSSSLIVTLGWTDHGQALTASGTAMTANTVTTFQSGTLMVYLDALTPITYATTYASVGGQAMTYQVYVLLSTQGI